MVYKIKNTFKFNLLKPLGNEVKNGIMFLDLDLFREWGAIKVGNQILKISINI